MAASLLSYFRLSLQTLENAISFMLFHHPPPEPFCLATLRGYEKSFEQHEDKSVIEKLLGDGFLWAVPRNRRTIEKRWKRKYGSPQYEMKILLPKTNLLTCNTCGHFHEAGVLCPNCYSKVRAETEAMKTAIQAELGLDAVEQEVVVLYKGERKEQVPEFWKGKRIVEVEKERPPWFSKNLMQQTTQQPSDSGDVKPTELG